MSSPREVWVLHDGRRGHRRQSLALAEALALAPRELTLQPGRLARWLAPRRWPGAERALGDEFAAMLATPPALAIGCGRVPALATRLLRERGTRVVQILHPRIDARHWDLVIAPEHDGLSGANLIACRGSLNPVDDVWLANARARFPRLAALPGPRTAVLLGGPTPAVAFGRSAFEVLASKLEYQLAREGGSLIICGSPRTPPELAPIVRERYCEGPGVLWMDESDGENFYAGALAFADRIIVSPDSVNMIAEACATSAPVFVAEPHRATGRVRRYIADLEASGRVRAQTREPEFFEAIPLRETARIAARVRERLGLD
ncbi:mitochondrial fission ELM1 family protein [Arenimonas sp.]|uniref:mitochondrial fission ELM1 family protein n=1 Tax=Arenimonas sp. TaxID=1872635 RepID=UPI0039E22552